MLDAIRWMAAALVALGHIRALSWVQGSAIDHANVAIRLFYAITSTGVESVAVFFVLSGFLVGGVNYTRFLQGKFDLQRFSIDRVTRIYTVLVPILLGVAILDFAGRHGFANSLYYSGGNPLVAERFGFFNIPSVRGYLANILALQDFYAPVFGSDIPLWSLSYEIWFYLLAAAAFVAGSSGKSVRIAMIAATIAVIAILGTKFVFFLALWLIGLAAHRLSRAPRRHGLLPRYAILALLPLTMLASAQIHFTVTIGRTEIRPMLVAVALICAMTLVMWRHADAILLRHGRRLNAFLASFSFTLYLVHFPVALVIISGIVGRSVPDPTIFAGFQPLSLQGMLTFGGAAAGAFGVAVGAAAMTEWRTAEVRQFVSQFINKLSH